ncbi:MAG: hypothetical protein AAGF11_03245 [Myxococcota bacterium]
MRTLTLHVGTHKTGSTSLQAFLLQNKARLADRGYDYPTEGCYCWPRSGHSPLAHALAGTRPAWLDPARVIPGRVECVQAIRRRIEQVGAPHVLISTEHFFTHVPPQVLRQTFDGLGYHLRVLVFLRPQDEFLESRYAQSVKVGRCQQSFESFVQEQLADRTSYGHYLPPLRRLAAAFGPMNLLLRTFRSQQPRTRLFSRFLEAVGLDLDDDFILPEARNASLPAELTRTLAALQAQIEGEQVRRASLNRWLLEANRPPAFPDSETRLLSPEAAQRIMACFEEQNAEIARSFLGRKELFAPSGRSTWPVAAPPTLEQLADAAIHLWFGMHQEQQQLREQLRRLRAPRTNDGPVLENNGDPGD